MKKTLLFVLVFCGLKSFSQNATKYSYSTGTNASLAADMNGNTIDLTTGNTQIFANNSVNQSSTLINIGFSFIFMGASYTQFAVTSNGVITLGATESSNKYGNSFPEASLAIIAPYWQNIKSSSTGQVHYKLCGTFPTRVLVIEFSNMCIDQASSSADGTFQARLYEFSNIIEFVYGAMAVGGVSNPAQNKISAIGISNNTGANNEFSIDHVTLTTTTGASALTNTHSTTGALANLNSSADGSRRYFRWTPPITPAFGYTATTYCVNGTNPSPNYYSVGTAGTFTSSPAGLSINSSNGAINLSLSSAGTYIITNTVTIPTTSNTISDTTTLIIGGFPSDPTSVTTSVSSMCLGGNSNLNATSAGSTINWYNVSSGGTPLSTVGSGINYNVTPSSTGIINYYAESQAANGCPSSSRVSVSINVSAQPVAGTLSGSPSAGAICTGSTVSATLTAGSGGAGTITDVLQYRYDGGTWTSYTSGAAISTTGHTSIDVRTYRTATGSNCTTSSINTISWTISAQPVAGTLSATPAVGTICTGSNVSATLTAGSGGTGTIADVLQYRYDGGSWTTYTSGTNLSTTGHNSIDIQTYRTATGSNCNTSSVNTKSWTINAQPVAGTLSASPATGSICTGGNVSAALTAGSGGSGTVTDVLQFRYDGGSWVTYTSGTNLSTTGHTSIDIQTYRTATGSNCSTSSVNTVSWSITAQPVSGTLTETPAAGTICTGGNISAILTAGSGGSGTVTDILQYRYDGGSWTAYTSGSNLSTSGHTSVDIQTYRTATGSNCSTSSTITKSWTLVSPPVSGTLAASPSTGAICAGSTVSATQTAGSGGTGTITDVLQYRYDGGSWTSYTSGTNLSTTGHTSIDIQTYRTATGSSCTTSAANSVSWTISAQPVAGTLSATPAAGTICIGSNISAILTAGSGGGGTVADVLQYRYDGGSWTTYTSGTNLATTGHTSADIRTYRTATGSNCTTSSTNIISWTFAAQPVAGTLSPSPAAGSICTGGNVSAPLTAGSGGSGTVADVLQYRFDGGSWTTYTSGSNLSTTGHTSIDIQTYRTATGGSCTTSSVNMVSWTISAVPVAGTLSATPAAGAICTGGNVSAALTAGSGGIGTVTDILEYRYDGGAWIAYTSGTNLATTGYSSVDIRTYRTATGTGCTTSSTNTVSWTISAQPVSGTLAKTPNVATVCTGSNVSAILTAGTGGSGTIADILEYRLDGGAWNSYTSGSNISTTGHTSIVIRTYRTATGSDCNTASARTVSWTIVAQPIAGTLNGSPAQGVVCSGGTVSATLTAGSGGTGTVTDILEYRYDGGSWTTYTSGTNLATTGHTSVDIRTYRTATGSNCTSSSTNTLSWTVTSAPVSGTLTASPAAGSVCSGSNVSAILTAGSGGSGTVTDILEYRYDGGTWNTYTSGTNISTTGHTSIDIQTYRTATGSSCTTSSPNMVSWTIAAQPVAGTLTETPGAGVICTGGNIAAVLTAGSGGSGTVTDILEYRYDGGSWTTYTSGTNLSTTGHTTADIQTYRNATGSGCTTSSSNVVSWTINPQPVAGSLSATPAAGTICAGNNVSAVLSAGSGGSGSIVDVMQYRYDGGSWTTYTSGTNLSTAGHTSIDIQTYRTATGTDCTTSSVNMVSWLINAQPVPGVLSESPSAGAVCAGANVSATLTAGSGGSGTITDIMEYRYDGGSWATYTAGTNLSTTGHTSVDIQTYRTATGSSCSTSSANMVSWTITAVPVAGTLTPTPATGAICTGGNVSATLTAGSGGTGTITDVMEYRLDGGAWVAYTSGTNLATTGHTSVDIRTYRTATGSGCTTSSVNTSSWTITAKPVAGTLAKTPNAATVCTGSNVSAILTAGTGGTGTITDILEYRVDGGAWNSYTSGTTIATTGHTSINVRTYRTATGSNCTTSTIRTATWNIVAQPVAGTLTASPVQGVVCSGGNVSASLTAGSGGTGTVTDVLQYRYDGGSWTTYTSGTNLSTTGHTSVDIKTYRTATGSNCTTSSTNTVSWTVTAAPVSGTLTSTPAAGAVCGNTNVSAVSTAGSGGAGTVTDVLQYRYDGGSWATYTSGSILSTTGHTSIDIQTYRTATGSGCATSTANTVSWTITAVPSATISYAASQYCMATGSQSVILFGTSGGVFSASPSGAALNAATGAIDLSSTLNGTYNIDYTVAATGGCALFSTSTTISVNNFKWTGATNTDWNTTGNWAGGEVPSASCPLVIIPNTANKPTITSGTASVKSLQIDAGATVTVTGAKLQVAGTITSNAAIIAQTGTIELNGSAAQSVSSSMFAGKTVNTLINSNSMQLDVTGTDTLLISNALLFGTVSNSVFNTNNKVTLLSRDTLTAGIGQLINGNSIAGNITVERYIPNHSKAWQLLCAPTKGQSIKNAWQEGASTPNGNPNPGYGTMLTGAMTSATSLGFDVATPGNGSIKVYNDTTGVWVPIPSTYVGINNSNGYMLFVRGDRSVITYNGAPTATILRSTGTLYQPSDPAPSLSVQQGKYETVANPYASAIDFSRLTRNGGVADMFFVWDPKIAGDYGYGGWQTFVSNYPSPGYSIAPGGGSYSSGNTSIESGSAFMVYSPFTAGTLEFNETCKVSGSKLVTRPGGLTDQIQLNLLVPRNNSLQLIDGVLTQVDADYNNSIDIHDAPKVNPEAETISIESGGKLLSVERRHFEGSDTIVYHLGAMRKQPYQLEVITQELNDAGRTAFMEDRFLNQLTPIELDGRTIIPFTITTDPMSYKADRFRVIFKQAAVLPVTFTSITAKRIGERESRVDLTVNNEIRIEKYILEKSTTGTSFEKTGEQLAVMNNGSSSAYKFTDNNAGNTDLLYRVKAINADGRIQYSSVAKLAAIKKQNAISIYPNPVTNHQVNILVEKAGQYELALFNSDGKLNYESDFKTVSANSTEVLMLPATLSKGQYKVLIKNQENQNTIINIQIL